MIARHGNIKEWHFAHASRDVFDKTEKKCEYSFYVSVRMMARQIIGEELSLSLPAYETYVSEYISGYGEISIPFTVTKTQEITLLNIELEHPILGTVVDVIGNVNQYNFIVYFTHPGRKAPENLISPSNNNFGIISISLMKLEMLFLEAKDSKKTYQKILYDFLASDIDARKWLFHPRFEQCKAKATKLLKTEVNIQKQQIYYSELAESEFQIEQTVSERDTLEPPQKRMMNYRCMFGSARWQGLHPGGSECPTCKNLVCRIEAGYVD